MYIQKQIVWKRLLNQAHIYISKGIGVQILACRLYHLTMQAAFLHLYKVRNFFEQISRFLREKSKSLTSLIFKEWREQFAKGCSFFKSEESKSLMVAH